MAKFEDNLAALETVVERLERGDLSLEDSVKLFEDGVRLSGACKAELEAAEGKIQLLAERGKHEMAPVNFLMDEGPDDIDEEAE